jgi:hypothetical protein
MQSRPALLSAAVAAALAALLAPSRADAFERQWHAGASFGYALLADPGSYPGFGGRLHLAYGLTDTLNALVEFDMASHPGGDLMALGGSAGVAYVVDILQWVPYLGMEVGGYDFLLAGTCGGAGEPSCSRGKLGGGIPFGIDYLITRSFALGAAGKYTFLLPGEDATFGNYLTVYARAEFIWGY